MKLDKATLSKALLALPLIGMLGVIMLQEVSLIGAEACRLKIEGFDPRSLLYGHYLTFRYAPNQTVEGRACLDKINAAQKVSKAMMPMPLRYYVDENDAQRLEGLLRDQSKVVTLEVKITSAGMTVFDDLYIDGMPWKAFRKTP